MYLPCRGVHLLLNVFVICLGSESFIILVFFCHCSSDLLLINFAFTGYVSTSTWLSLPAWKKELEVLAGTIALFYKD